MRFTTLSNYYFIDWWCDVDFRLFACWFNFRFCYSFLTWEKSVDSNSHRLSSLHYKRTDSHYSLTLKLIGQVLHVKKKVTSLKHIIWGRVFYFANWGGSGVKLKYLVKNWKTGNGFSYNSRRESNASRINSNKKFWFSLKLRNHKHLYDVNSPKSDQLSTNGNITYKPYQKAVSVNMYSWRYVILKKK